MPSLAALTTFFGASLLLALAPGPDNLFVLTQSLTQGRLAGLLVTLGLCTGLFVHTGAVALGVAAIFQTSQLAFVALKSLGAGYLLYLAWRSFRATATGIRAGTGVRLAAPGLYLRGIVMNVTNPKVSIFFLAFLPQFADPAAGPLPLQIGALGALFMLATLLVFGAVALLAGTLGQRLAQSARLERFLNRAAAAVFAALAVKLALSQR